MACSWAAPSDAVRFRGQAPGGSRCPAWRSLFQSPFVHLRPMANGKMVTPSARPVSVCATQHFAIVLARQIGVRVSWMDRSGCISLMKVRVGDGWSSRVGRAVARATPRARHRLMRLAGLTPTYRLMASRWLYRRDSMATMPSMHRHAGTDSAGCGGRYKMVSNARPCCSVEEAYTRIVYRTDCAVTEHPRPTSHHS